MFETSTNTPLTVTGLNQAVRELLEQRFFSVLVEGELSNLARPASGHWYFSLKDAASQVRCAMFRGQNRTLGFGPAEGQQVLVRARVSLYTARGDYQLIVEHMEPAGEGALRAAFERLKARLAEEGLFEAAAKKPLPALPARIGVITSPSGAAIHDILTVLGRRFPAVPVRIYPVAVQGADASPGIVDALRTATLHHDCEVLILARGGGSLEDLQPFNEEPVARAIHACPIPVITGIGHETDFTIADFVADLRAPTPSAAAESVTPDREEWRRRLAAYQQSLYLGMRNRLATRRQQLRWLSARLQHPQQRLREVSQRLDGLSLRLAGAMLQRHRRQSLRLNSLGPRLARQHPGNRLKLLRAGTDSLSRRLGSAWQHNLELRRNQLSATARELHAISPLATLDRGYAIVSRVQDGAVVRSADAVQPGDRVQARLARGYLECRVETRFEDA